MLPQKARPIQESPTMASVLFFTSSRRRVRPLLPFQDQPHAPDPRPERGRRQLQLGHGRRQGHFAKEVAVDVEPPKFTTDKGDAEVVPLARLWVKAKVEVALSRGAYLKAQGVGTQGRALAAAGREGPRGKTNAMRAAYQEPRVGHLPVHLPRAAPVVGVVQGLKPAGETVKLDPRLWQRRGRGEKGAASGPGTERGCTWGALADAATHLEREGVVSLPNGRHRHVAAHAIERQRIDVACGC